LNILEHPGVSMRMNDPIDHRERLAAEAKAAVMAHARDKVFYVAPEAKRLASAHPASGMNQREIVDLLMAEAVARRLAVDSAFLADE
jgi:hypothetical protein